MAGIATDLQLQIRRDDLSDPRIAAFLEEHLQDMRATSPPESVHALDLTQLRHPSVRFWSAWLPDASGALQLAGTGALKRLDHQHAEVKSMRTAVAWRGSGFARQMLRHIVADARAAGQGRLSLETGSQPFFEPARQLYLSEGFVPCEPFGDYRPDPNSCFLTLAL